MSVTHVVGPMIGFKELDRVIQRCAVCGEKLEDYHPSRIAIQITEGSGACLPMFPEAKLLRVQEGNPKSYTVLGDFETYPLPEDFCLSLVEE